MRTELPLGIQGKMSCPRDTEVSLSQILQEGIKTQQGGTNRSWDGGSSLFEWHQLGFWERGACGPCSRATNSVFSGFCPDLGWAEP